MTLARQFAAELLADTDSWVVEVLDQVREAVPVLVRDAAAEELAAASSRALLVEFAAALTAGEHGEFAAPDPALRFGRYLARTGVPLSLLLRSYRLGQELLFSRAAELAEATDIAGLRDVGLLTFRYVDAVMGEVTEAFEREREAVLRGSALRRERMVTRLLAGEEPPLSEVERILGWRMAGEHRALVAWSGAADVDATAVLAAVRRVLGLAPGPVLVLPGPNGEVYAWSRPAGPLDVGEIARVLADSSVQVAIGDAAPGLAGFVRSRRQADAARRVARQLPARPVVLHEDVALLHLLLADPGAAAVFISDQLGALAADRHVDLRATVRAYLEHGQDTTATAVSLRVHRNTVMRRVAKAAELLGRSVTARPTETLAALLLSEVDLAR